MIELHGLAAPQAATLPLYGIRPAGLEAFAASQPAPVAAQLAGANFTAASGSAALLFEASGACAGAVLGLGDGPALHGFGAAATALPGGSCWHIAPGDYPAEEAALGFLLGAYRFGALKTGARKPLARLGGAVPARAKILGEAITLARDLINTPANLLGPAELAAACEDTGAAYGARTTRITGAELGLRYPALAAVGAGSDRAPEVAILEWAGHSGPDAPRISLCGKGVCFDTGGYDLKPSAAMLRMKKDMGGAAILLGLARAIMALNLPVHLRLAIGCVENSISGHAMRPSDVLRTARGLTVEVGNTDAEGRLVLCDLLAEAASLQPDWLIDAATLTGAARVALGPDLPALFCRQDDLAERILASGRLVDDPLWRLPLHGGYDSWLDSPVADLNTVAAKPMAGAIIAALFLARFVPDSIAWAHIDVYAWNDSNRPGRPEGGEAQTLRAVLHAIETTKAKI